MSIKNHNSALADSGFKMPPEWSPHSTTWLSWPHNKETWPKNLAEAQQEYLALILAIANDEPVLLNFATADLSLKANQQLAQFSDIARQNIQLSICPTNDAWIRDYGPSFVTDGVQLVAVDWTYNAWGGKYPPFDDDQRFVERILQTTHSGHPIQRFKSNLCLEGGAIEVDDSHIAMCTRSCALNANRNVGWQLAEIEVELKNCLGVDEVIWLSGNAISGDDTDGHIDQLARFAPGRKILYATCNDLDDPQHESLVQNERDLRANLSAKNLDYELIPLPLPTPVIYDGVQLPASYCNFYITNHSVIVPTFDQRKSDDQALAIIGDVFTDRKIVGLPSLHLCWGLGSFHCLTQQQPAIETSRLT